MSHCAELSIFCSPGGSELVGTWMCTIKTPGHVGLGIRLHLACELNFTWGIHFFCSFFSLHFWLY